MSQSIEEVGRGSRLGETRLKNPQEKALAGTKICIESNHKQNLADSMFLRTSHEPIDDDHYRGSQGQYELWKLHRSIDPSSHN